MQFMEQKSGGGGKGWVEEDMVGAGNGRGQGGDSKACRDAVLVALDLEELEKRVVACEKADHLMQAGSIPLC